MLRSLDRRGHGVSRGSEPRAPAFLRFLADLHTRELATSTRSLGCPSALRTVAGVIEPLRNLSRSYRELAPPASRACVTAADPDNQPRCRDHVRAGRVPDFTTRDAHSVVHNRARGKSRIYRVRPQPRSGCPPIDRQCQRRESRRTLARRAIPWRTPRCHANRRRVTDPRTAISRVFERAKTKNASHVGRLEPRVAT